MLWLRAVLGLCTLALVVGCSASGNPTTSASSTEPEMVFSWGDDLRQWVTEDEMADALEDLIPLQGDASHERGVAVIPLDAGGGYKSWVLLLYSEDGSIDALGQPGGFRVELSDDVVARDTPEAFGPAQTDPRLPQGVVYQEGSGWFQHCYVLRGPHSGESCMLAVGPLDMPTDDGDEGLYPDAITPQYEDMVFTLASIVLGEMGWAD